MKSYINNYTSLDFSELKISYSNNIYEAAIDADAIVILTEWDEFIDYDWKKIFEKMASEDQARRREEKTEETIQYTAG